MLEFFNTTEILQFVVSTLFGSMIFFSAIIAPTIFASLDQINSRKLIRKIFPKLYSWGIFLGLIICILQINNKSLHLYLSIFVMMGFVFSRQILMPKINELSDKKDEKNFKKLHTLSVLIFISQLVILLFIF